MALFYFFSSAEICLQNSHNQGATMALYIFCLFGAHNQWFSEVSPGSVLWNHFGRLGGPFWMLKIKPESVACKGSILLSVLLLQSQHRIFFTSYLTWAPNIRLLYQFGQFITYYHWWLLLFFWMHLIIPTMSLSCSCSKETVFKLREA